MEMARLNAGSPAGVRDEEEEEEEEEVMRREEAGRCGSCPSCESLHNTVSKWMLPENARTTYLERASCLPPPVFILAISAAELAMFIYYAVWKPQTQWITLDTGISESPLMYRPDKRREAWRFLSYMLVHAGIEHIIGNLVLQLVLGIPLELVHKGHRVGLVYLAGVVGGSLASSICDPLMGLVGASGGVYALIGGYFMNVLVNFQEMIPLFGAIRLLLVFFIDSHTARIHTLAATCLDHSCDVSVGTTLIPPCSTLSGGKKDHYSFCRAPTKDLHTTCFTYSTISI